MDIQTKKQIITQLDRVNHYAHRLVDTEGQLYKIERDTLLGHLRELYNLFLHLNLEADYTSKPSDTENEKPINEADKESEAPKESAEFDQLKKNIDSLKKQFEEVEKSQGKQELKQNHYSGESHSDQKDTAPESQKKKDENAIREEKSYSKNESKQASGENAPSKAEADHNKKTSRSLGETFNEQKSSLNDYLSLNKPDNTIGEKMKQNRITDLKAAIDINHKFLFIRDLFEGNSTEYNETIEQINNANSLEEAFNILGEKKEKYNWDQKESTFRIFNDLIHRKFQ